MQITTEGALWGSVKAHGLLPDTVIVSDDAGQFNVGRHGLCWVHSERLVHKLETFTEQTRAIQQRQRSLIWSFYDDLKAYRRDPSPNAGPSCGPASTGYSDAALALPPLTDCWPDCTPTKPNC